MNNTITPKYYSKKELAAQYGISVRHLRREVLQQKIFKEDYYNNRRLLSPADLKKIYDKIGEP